MPTAWGGGPGKPTHGRCRKCRAPHVKLRRDGTMQRHQNHTGWGECARSGKRP